MRYCADAWYLLGLFSHDQKAERIFRDVTHGKDMLLIPLTVFAETTKKLLQQGNKQEKIDLFFETVESSEKIKIIPPDKGIAREAARISLAHGLSMLDSFAAATAKISSADTLLTADADYAPLVKKKYIKTQSW
ncbi:PIN domain-containing protein [Candidatus Woesearchaeota archaeon]|nr:PIN domain-containing protein [Candidatus Woesearchaeota archaeon]